MQILKLDIVIYLAALLFGPTLCRVALCSVSHGALSTESAALYRMARFLGIPRKCSAFCRKRRFLKSAENIAIQ